MLLAIATGTLAWSIARAWRRRAEERLVSEAIPRVSARLARLGGAIGLEPPAPAPVPMAAAMTMAPPAAAVSSSPASRRRSISSALVPWAGARGGSSPAASVAVAPAHGTRSGEAAVMQRAAMTVGPSLWRPESYPGALGRPPADPRWRMWRDASAALVAFALVGLVLVGGDLLRIPTGPLPATPGLIVAAVGQPSAAPTPTTVAIAIAIATDPPVLVTPSPSPVVATPSPTPAATPPETGPTAHPTSRPTAKPTAKPTAPPPLEPAFFCDTYAPVVLVPVTCHVNADNGKGVAYQWLVSDNGGTFQQVAATRTLTYAFPTIGYFQVEVVLKRGSQVAPSDPSAFNVFPAP